MRLEWQKEQSRLKSELESLGDAISWVGKFESDSLVPLQKQYAELKPNPEPAGQEDGRDTNPAETDKTNETETADSKPVPEVDASKNEF